jgi:hypothetical protein
VCVLKDVRLNFVFAAARMAFRYGYVFWLESVQVVFCGVSSHKLDGKRLWSRGTQSWAWET